MDKEALVRALRKFEQQNESLKKAVSALQSEADARDYLVTQMLLGLNVPEYRKSQDEKEFEDLSKTDLWYVGGLGFFIRFVVFGYGDILEDPFELRVSHVDQRAIRKPIGFSPWVVHWSNRRLRFSSSVDDDVTNALKKWESCYHFNKRDGDPTAPWAILYTNGSVKKRFKLFNLIPQGCFPSVKDPLDPLRKEFSRFRSQ